MSFETDDEAVKAFFPDASAVRIMKDPQGQSKGFGYVEFPTQDKLKEALATNGTQLAGRTIRVTVAEARESLPVMANCPSQTLMIQLPREESSPLLPPTRPANGVDPVPCPLVTPPPPLVDKALTLTLRRLEVTETGRPLEVLDSLLLLLPRPAGCVETARVPVGRESLRPLMMLDSGGAPSRW